MTGDKGEIMTWRRSEATTDTTPNVNSRLIKIEWTTESLNQAEQIMDLIGPCSYWFDTKWHVQAIRDDYKSAEALERKVARRI